MNLKDKLKQQASQTLSTSSNSVVVSNNQPVNSIESITLTIKSHLQELEEIKNFFIAKKKEVSHLREKVIEMLIYVRDNRINLLSGSFENYLESEIGITKGYFYEQVQAYELCQLYGVPEYFSEIDYKILVMIARVKDVEKQKKLIEKAPSLTRESIKKVSQTDNKVIDITTIDIQYQFENPKKLVIQFDSGLSEKDKQEILSFLDKNIKYLLKKD